MAEGLLARRISCSVEIGLDFFRSGAYVYSVFGGWVSGIVVRCVASSDL